MKNFFFGCIASVFVLVAVNNINLDVNKTDYQQIAGKLQSQKEWTLSRGLTYQMVGDSTSTMLKNSIEDVTVSLPESKTSNKTLENLIKTLDESKRQWSVQCSNGSYLVLIRNMTGSYEAASLEDIAKKVNDLI